MSSATAAKAAPAKKRGSGLYQGLQKIGRSLQLPIAVLPAAGILNRLGQDDVFGEKGLGWIDVSKVFVAAGFEATLVCVDPKQLDPSFAGRRFDRSLLADLPESVDPCGENGEFHTFVHAGPIFARSIAVAVGETVERDGFFFTDLTPEQS